MTEPTGQKLLFTVADVVEYYEQFRPAQMEHFARFVITKGYGAVTPNGRKDANGRKEPETWQACGRRLYGERFIAVMERVLAEHRAAIEAQPQPAAAIADPEF